MVVDVVRSKTQTYNLVAETRYGNPKNVVMVGAHLDSVFEGPGINDNGSGSAALLEMAVLLRKAYPLNKIRFAWWGAEESGLVGSTYYVNNLTPEEKKKIKAYLNFDMIGSPNYANFIYDGDGSSFGLQGPPGSAAIEHLFEAYFGCVARSSRDRDRLPPDYAQFFEDGIAFGGLFTGAEDIKTEEQAQKYGGAAGQPFDPCYRLRQHGEHRSGRAGDQRRRHGLRHQLAVDLDQDHRRRDRRCEESPGHHAAQSQRAQRRTLG